MNDLILRCTGADKIAGSSLIQSLWSGYGEIRRVKLIGGVTSSVIVKHHQLHGHSRHITDVALAMMADDRSI